MTFTVEELVHRLYTKYYSPNDDMWENWKMEEAPRGQQARYNRIKQLLDEGHKVKTGYGTTSVRGYHVSYIFYKD